MIITESNAKMKIGDKYFTFMQKDEESQFKFHFDGGYINLATKDEVMTNHLDVIYRNNVKAFYKHNGKLIQLAFKENFDFPQHYELLFNSQEGFIRTDNIESDEHFTTAKVLNVSSSVNIIEYNKHNLEIVANDESRFNKIDELIMLAEKITTPTQDIIDFRTETEITYNNVETNNEMVGAKLYSTKSSPNTCVIDFKTVPETKITYNNIESNNEMDGARLCNVKSDISKHMLDFILEETYENVEINNVTRHYTRGAILPETEVND